ncbi:MAG: hypothetical protein M3Q07_25520, partial [Pseudobdellovibrionaceae bacterium]|nr:hypothetical protein [Pseudobdellovibrionaceae bacterium]
MLKLNCERGNASLVGMFAFVGVLGLYVTHDQKKTQNMRSEVLGSTMSSMAKQANEAALSRTKNLLQKNANGQPGVNIQNNAFAAGAGSNIQIEQGKLVIKTPDPRSAQWMSNSLAAGPQLITRVALEKIESDPALDSTAAIAVAETTITTDGVSKTHRTRARYDLLALNPSPNPAPSPGTDTTTPSN